MSHPVVHFEVAGKDQQALVRFYTDLFGWQVQPVEGMPYALVEKEGEGIGGGIGGTPEGSPGHVTFYVQADDPQASLDRAVELGGQVVLPVTEMPMVTIALFTDPEGHLVGLVKGM